MSNEELVADSSAFEGKMFLYEQPELLNKEDHGKLGLSKVARPYEFIKSIRGVPIVTNEMPTAQKHYPIVFSDFENPVLIAVVGVIEDVNLFVDEDGHWDKMSYIPSYVRCHPFAFARRPDEQFAVVIDRTSAEISDKPEVPFFDGDKLSEGIQSRVDFCGHYDVERNRSKEFCEKVKELGLLSGQRAANRPGDGEKEDVIADYVAIDVKKLTELDKDTLQALHKDGSLSAIFAHIFSLENWNRLLFRRALMQKAASAT
ncbi:MAG: SapC family protein [Woeseia sp.]